MMGEISFLIAVILYQKRTQLSRGIFLDFTHILGRGLILAKDAFFWHKLEKSREEVVSCLRPNEGKDWSSPTQ